MQDSMFAGASKIDQDQAGEYLELRVETAIKIDDIVNSLVCSLGIGGAVQAIADHVTKHDPEEGLIIASLEVAANRITKLEDEG